MRCRSKGLRDEGSDAPQPFPVSGCAPAFAKLRSLTHLTLSLKGVPVALPNVVGALVPLTGLAELTLDLSQPAVVPAALGQLKGLRQLKLCKLDPCSLEAGCFHLPNLQMLELVSLWIEHAAGVAGISALQRLTSIRFSGGQGAPVFAQLVHLPRLAHISFGALWPGLGGEHLALSRLPNDMGALSSTLQSLNISGNNLTQFPLVLTQLGALARLDASGNNIAELPAAITALSRLTSLLLGRAMSADVLQLLETRCLDVRALGDLSGFPALCELSFSHCEVVLCGSVLSAVQHASLTSLFFNYAHPAPLCEGVVLQLGQVLRQLNRGSMLKVRGRHMYEGMFLEEHLLAASGRAPVQKFIAALEACGL